MNIDLIFNFLIDFLNNFGKFIMLKDFIINKYYLVKGSLNYSKDNKLEENKVVIELF